MKFRIFVPLAGDSIRADWLEYKDILVVKPNNSSHLCKTYNEAIENAIEDKIDALILSHDDIRIEDKYIFEKIEKGFEDYDILGIAGEKGEASEMPTSIRPTVAWNSGICQHTHRYHTDYYGSTPSQCVMMDGCFLIININKIGTCRFDEEMPVNGTEKYDVDFTANATFRHGLKCATWPIWVRHDSEGVGATSGENWDSHELCKEYFIKKWKFPNGKGFK